MKSSIYNVYKRDKDEYIVLNTLSQAVIRIDEETKDILEKNPDDLPDDISEPFLENGIIVEDGFNERKIVAYHLDKDKYNVIPHDLGYTVAMTYACNLACPYCYEGTEKDTKKFDRKKVDILLKHMDRNLSKRNFEVLRIGLYGGEPLLVYPLCVQLMEGASTISDQHGKEFEGALVTNGVLMTEEIINTLVIPYCEKVQVTMDGGRKAHNERRILKDGGGTYDTLLGVLTLLKDAERDVELRLNVDKENATTFVDLFRDLIDLGLQDMGVTVAWIHPPDADRFSEGCSGYTEKCFSREEMADFEDQINVYKDELGIPRGQPTISSHHPCTFDREDIYLVDPYLDLYKCWEFIGQKDKKVGYIDEEGETVFAYEYYEQLSRNPLEYKECRDCSFLPMCAGGCAAQAYLENGTYHSSPCRKHKYALHKHVDKYMEQFTQE